MRPAPLERLGRLLALDGACVVALNRVLAYRPCLWLARAVSRMGDGELWGVLILGLLLLPGQAGLRCALHMGAVALVGVALYLLIKRRAGRPRPCVRLAGLTVCARPLDEFSFPSGHTMHAVAFAIIAFAYFPLLGLALAGFAVLTAVVRVVLGLHYPSDVLAGSALGATLATLSLALVLPA
ncbi:phosphatase PAP2 family protein [Azoarcus sp. TTM-91]|uniref:phosphatase PAP2 family protein n=1 Tax=Azoarcus sp. TTM-91 TaxID=2691581 RepID=UPI00145EFAF8|nr:phosphatase PAP2 family protein [Azoarcus sp. TTM-91]NMG36567.1 phosphatase PAP2 family protein [Azoarcus sp. TTM-91]